MNKFNQKQRHENDLLVENTHKKEAKLRSYLELIKLFYHNLNITMDYTIESEWECNLPKHKSMLKNIQSQWKNCSYSTFLTNIKKGKIKGIYTIK